MFISKNDKVKDMGAKHKVQWSVKECLLKLLPLVITISFAMDVFVPSIPVMVDYFHSTDTVLQASLYLFMFMVGFTQLLLGFAPHRYSRRVLALGAAVLFFLGSVICSFATHVPMLLIGRVVQAIGATGTYTIAFIFVRDHYDTQRCAIIFSLLLGYNSVVASLAPVIGGILLDLTGAWQSGFYFLMLLGLFVIYRVDKSIPEYEVHAFSEDKGSSVKNLLAILANPYFTLYAMIGASALLGLYLFCALSPAILITQLQNTPFQYGLWFALNALTVFVANALAARLTLRHPLQYIVNKGLILMITGCCLMYYFTNHYFTSLSFMGSMLVITFGIGFAMGSSEAIALEDYEDNSIRATSLFCFIQFFVSGLVGFLISFVALSPVALFMPVLVATLISFLMFSFKHMFKALRKSG